MKDKTQEEFIFQGGKSRHGLHGYKDRKYLKVLRHNYGLFSRYNGYQYLFRHNAASPDDKHGKLVLIDRKSVGALDGLEVSGCDNSDMFSYIVHIVETTEGTVLFRVGPYGGGLDLEWPHYQIEEITSMLRNILDQIGDGLEFG